MPGTSMMRRPQTFADAVVAARLAPADALVVFRRLLEALARPGRPVWMPSSLVGRVPPVLLPSLTLADLETTVHVAQTPEEDGSTPMIPWERVVRTVTGARRAELVDADWVAALGPISPDDIRGLRRGTALAPEQGARLAVRCAAVRPGGFDPWPLPEARTVGVGLVLEGPGVDGRATVSVEQVEPGLIEALVEVNTDFPSGVDTWLVADTGAVIGLPRSTRINIVSTWGPGGH